MSNRPLFQHRHYVWIASRIAQIEDSAVRATIASTFANELRGTNPGYSAERFNAAAMGLPLKGRDKAD